MGATSCFIADTNRRAGDTTWRVDRQVGERGGEDCTTGICYGMRLHSRHTIVSKRLSRSKEEIDDMLHSLYEFFRGHVGIPDQIRDLESTMLT